MKRILKSAIPVLLSLAMMTGCVKEVGLDSPQITSGETLVAFHVELPAPEIPTTRTGIQTVTEASVDNIYVLIFDKDNKFVDKKIVAKAQFTSETGDADKVKSFTIALPLSKDNDDKYNIALLANVTGDLATAINAFTEGNDRETVLAGLTKTYAGNPSMPVPMASVPIAAVKIDENTSFTGTNGFNMIRMVARIDVSLAEGIAVNYSVKQVLLYNYNTKGRVWTNNFDGTKAEGVTLPSTPGTSAAGSKYAVENGKDGSDKWLTNFSSRLYALEAQVADVGAARPCIIIELADKDGVSMGYYRADFQASDNTYLDLLRNHRYLFNITKIHGTGFTDPDVAYNSMKTDLDCHVIEWDESDMKEIYVSGNYYFGIQRREVKFSAFGGLTETVTIKTNIPDFSMSLAGTKQLQADGENDDYYNSANFGYMLENSGGEIYTLTITTKHSHVSTSLEPDHQDLWTIDAGNIKNLSFKVIQKWESTYISVVDGQSSRLYPEGATGAATIPLDIMSSVPVTVEIAPSEATSWITGITQPTQSGGIYTASMNIEVLPFKYGEIFDGITNRSAVITVTAGADVRKYTITQEAPYLSFNPVNIIFDRSSGNQTKPVQIQTNLLPGHYDFNFVNEDRLSCTPPVNAGISSRPRYQSFEVSVDLETPTPPTEGFGTTFTVTPKSAPTPDYGLDAVTGLVNVRSTANVWIYYWKKGTFLDAATPWNPGTTNSANGYFFPWNTTQVEFDVNTNVGLVERATDTGLNGGSLTLGTLSTSNGTSTYPYSFEFSNTDYTAPRGYELVFSPQIADTGEEDIKMTFMRGAQIWSRANWAGSTDPAAAAVDYKGYPSTAATVAVTNNIKWGARIDGFDPSVTDRANSWIKIRTVNTTAYAAPDNANDMHQNDRILLPNTDADVLKKTSNLSVQVTALNTLNDPALAASDYKRSARIEFESLETDGSGISLSDKFLTVTQYAPVLLNTTSGEVLKNETIPYDAKEYTVSVTTNLPGWTVKVTRTSGAGDASVGARSGTLPVTNSAAVENTQTVSIPENSNTSSRTFNLYLSCSGFSDQLLATITQERIPVKNYPAYPGVIGYDPVSKKLNLDGVGVMVYFKFGSVVAMYSGREASGHDGWYGNSSVAFNPSGVDCTNYENVPFADGASTFPDHAPATTGKGDPCKLIGLTKEDIKNMTEDQINNHDSGWRLPTGNPFEKFATNSNIYKSGSGSPTAQFNVTKYDYVPDANTVAENGHGNIATISLKDDAAKTFSDKSDDTAFDLLLPAAGYREQNVNGGKVQDQGLGGYYWSSTPMESGFGYSLGATETHMRPRAHSVQSYGFAVRCVRK